MRITLKRKFGRAFTLIELLIVITIIGILAVALVPRISQGPARARDVTRKTDLGSISTALEISYTDSGSYPASTNGGECLSSTSTAGALILPLLNGVVPNDPKSDNLLSPCLAGSAGYVYNRLTASTYVLAAQLEGTTSVGDNIYCGYDTFTAAPAATDLCSDTNNATPVTYVLSR